MEKDDCVDRIGGLPDGIVVDIISLLPLKEAVRTCVLSKRWISLWRYVPNLNLDFRPPKAILDLPRNPKSLKAKRSWFVNWVNNICSSHKSSTLEYFRVNFDLVDKGFRDDIDGWLDFAFAKKVKRLDLSLENLSSCRGSGSYFLSKDTFDRTIARRGLSSIGLLTSLCLDSVDVSGEVLEGFLSYCPSLEGLFVGKSLGLVKFKVTGPAPFPLKELGVFGCLNLQELEIDAPNLVCFSYAGVKLSLHMRNVPRLVNVSWNVMPDRNLIFATLGNQNGIFNRLHTLELIITQSQFNFINFSNPIELGCLQNLNLKVWIHPNSSLLVLTYLINASPSLKKLAMSLLWYRTRQPECSNKIKMHHQSLKVVEIRCFAGHKNSDCEFAKYILKHAVVLERIIFDTQIVENPERARENAWALKYSTASPSLEFVVL